MSSPDTSSDTQNELTQEAKLNEGDTTRSAVQDNEGSDNKERSSQADKATDGQVKSEVPHRDGPKEKEGEEEEEEEEEGSESGEEHGENKEEESEEQEEGKVKPKKLIASLKNRFTEFVTKTEPLCKKIKDVGSSLGRKLLMAGALGCTMAIPMYAVMGE